MHTSDYTKRQLENPYDVEVKELADSTTTGVDSDIIRGLNKREHGFVEVEVVSKKKLRVYIKEKFDFTKRIDPNESGGYSLDMVFQTAPSEVLDGIYLEPGLLESMLDKKHSDLVVRKNREYTYKGSECKAIAVVPEKEIKKVYVEGESLNELAPYLTIPIHLDDPYKKYKPHPEDCRCDECNGDSD